jgi:hypothetical protein
MLAKQNEYITRGTIQLGLRPSEIAQLIAGYVAKATDPMILGLLITSTPETQHPH